MNDPRIYYLTGVFIAISLALGSVQINSQPPQESHKALGIKVNERLAEIKQEDIKRTNAIWARGFLEFFDLYPDVEDLESDSNVAALKELKAKWL